MKPAGWVLVFVMIMACNAVASAADISHNAEFADTSKPFADRWSWAVRKAGALPAGDGYWFGYSITKWLPGYSFIGSYCSNSTKNRPTLGEFLYGSGMYPPPVIPGNDHRFGTMEGVFSVESGKRSRENVLRDIGILFHFTGGSAGKCDEVRVSSLILHVDLYGDPVFWLGRTGDDESCRRLEAVYAESGSVEVRKAVMMAVALHSSGETAFRFLSSVLAGAEQDELREEAAFWLGEENYPGAVDLLRQTAEHDHSEEVAKKAVFGLSQMDDTAATTAMIGIAKTPKRDGIRRESIFWLGQKASARAVATLVSIAGEDADEDIQEHAVFALSQLPGDRGVTALIPIAQSHSNSEVRKKAIFWLSQSDDPRALDAITDILRR